MRMVEMRVLSSDGIHTLAGRVWLPDGQPRGLFQVVHGMVEHVGRYDAFLQEMAAEGYISFGHDNLGHGQTARNESELGFIAHRQGWKYLAQDVGVFADAVAAQYGPALPRFLMGHSMGAFIVRLAAAEEVRPEKLIVMGTGGPNPACPAGLALVRSLKVLRGERHISKLIYGLVFGSYNKRFEKGDKTLWLTGDPAVREQYAADPYCSFRFTVSAMEDLLMLNQKANSGRWFATMGRRQIPTLLVSGGEDPVGGYGKGVQTVYHRLQKAGAPVRIRLYEGYRHEILNDASRGQVIGDIKAFLA